MLTLDAWLERSHPSLRIVDSGSRRVVAEWQGDELQRLFESGTIAPDDCRGPRSRESEHATIRALMLEACLEGLSVCRRSHHPSPEAGCASGTVCRQLRAEIEQDRPPREERVPSLKIVASGPSLPVRRPSGDIAKRPPLRVAFRKYPSAP